MNSKRDEWGALEILAEAMVTGDVGNAIINQEKRGQMDVVNREILPRDLRIYDDARTPEELYQALGIEVLGDADDLFFNVKLPDGWHKKGTEHQMHSDVLDSKGRGRIHIFYKAAFYDRAAHASIERRYGFHQLYDNGFLPFAIITDGGNEIARISVPTSADDGDGYNSHRAAGEAYLAEHYPDWRNPFAYWD